MTDEEIVKMLKSDKGIASAIEKYGFRDQMRTLNHILSLLGEDMLDIRVVGNLIDLVLAKGIDIRARYFFSIKLPCKVVNHQVYLDWLNDSTDGAPNQDRIAKIKESFDPLENTEAVKYAWGSKILSEKLIPLTDYRIGIYGTTSCELTDREHEIAAINSFGIQPTFYWKTLKNPVTMSEMHDAVEEGKAVSLFKGRKFHDSVILMQMLLEVILYLDMKEKTVKSVQNVILSNRINEKARFFLLRSILCNESSRLVKWSSNIVNKDKQFAGLKYFYSVQEALVRTGRAKELREFADKWFEKNLRVNDYYKAQLERDADVPESERKILFDDEFIEGLEKALA